MQEGDPQQREPPPQPLRGLRESSGLRFLPGRKALPEEGDRGLAVRKGLRGGHLLPFRRPPPQLHQPHPPSPRQPHALQSQRRKGKPPPLSAPQERLRHGKKRPGQGNTAVLRWQKGLAQPGLPGGESVPGHLSERRVRLRLRPRPVCGSPLFLNLFLRGNAPHPHSGVLLEVDRVHLPRGVEGDGLRLLFAERDPPFRLEAVPAPEL